jgi:hypothetical protein
MRRNCSQAQSGLRATARNLFQAGTKLDAMGDWVGALQMRAGAPDLRRRAELSDSLLRVREKLRVAGTNAFNQARQRRTADCRMR